MLWKKVKLLAARGCQKRRHLAGLRGNSNDAAADKYHRLRISTSSLLDRVYSCYICTSGFADPRVFGLRLLFLNPFSSFAFGLEAGVGAGDASSGGGEAFVAADGGSGKIWLLSADEERTLRPLWHASRKGLCTYEVYFGPVCVDNPLGVLHVGRCPPAMMNRALAPSNIQCCWNFVVCTYVCVG